MSFVTSINPTRTVGWACNKGTKISLSISNKEKIKQTSLSQFYNLCFRAQAQNSVHVPQDDISLTEPKTNNMELGCLIGGLIDIT